jgi:hypothetical protein
MRRSVMSRIKKSLALFLAASLVAASVPGCGDDGGTGANYTAPDLPPISTFLMDFSDFADERAAPSAIPDPGPGEAFARANWTYAASNLVVWNSLITFGFAIPAAAFLEAFNHEATRQPGGAWLWDYNFTVGAEHLAELYGIIDGDEVVWEMYISREDAYTEFLWFYGRSALDGSEGTWTLNQDPESETPVIEILWHRDTEAGTADIKYTNVVPGGAEYGGYIHYGITNEIPYDAFYDIFKVGVGIHTDIEWNLGDRYGRVRDLFHFGDDDWHCWNGAFEDTICVVVR